MSSSKTDLKKEHKNTLDCPCYKYSLLAKIFFCCMNMVAGKKDTLPKAKLLEILASIPYRVWELRHYLKQTREYKNSANVDKSAQIINWGRHAQDNEYTHLQVIHQKMLEDGIKDKWYTSRFVAFFIVLIYYLGSRLLACISQKRAFLFNAEFENHAEHVYAKLVVDNPQWEKQAVTDPLVRAYADVDCWADVFRRISLDERDHMIRSFEFCGRTDLIPKN